MFFFICVKDRAQVFTEVSFIKQQTEFVPVKLFDFKGKKSKANKFRENFCVEERKKKQVEFILKTGFHEIPKRLQTA